MQDYNILVTFHHSEKAKAEEEVAERITDSGLVLEDLMESSVPGLLLVRVAGDGKEALRKIRGSAFRFPELFRHTHRWIPIEEWVSSDLPAMIGAARAFGSRIGKKETWRLDLDKRRYPGNLSGLDLIKTLTEPVQSGVVELESPERRLVVEIIGSFAGFSLVSEEEVLNINEVRQTIGLAKVP